MMKIVNKKIRDLKPAEYNPRQLTEKQYKSLKESIVKYGFVDPIIINKNKDRKNIIVGGHQRYRIAKMMGMSIVPCVEVDLPLEEEQELNIRLNKNVGEWDWDMLANHFDNTELLNWGFVEQELGVEANLTFEVNNDYNQKIEYPDEAESSHVRMIQLFFTDKTEHIFKKMELQLREDFGTDNLTDTVFKAMEKMANG